MPSDKPENDGSKRKGRGSVNNKSRLGAFTEARDKRGGADWASADPRWLAGVVVACTRRGIGVTFGMTRDGGAYALTLYDRGERETLYFNGDAVLDDELEIVYHTIDALPE